MSEEWATTESPRPWSSTGSEPAPEAEGPAPHAESGDERATTFDSDGPETNAPSAPETINTNYGDAENVIQAGAVFGGIHTRTQHINYLSAEWYEAGRLDSRYVEYVRTTFVPGDRERYERFTNDLAESGFGVITGAVGTGRRSAAITALAGLGLPVRPVQVEEDEGWSPHALVCDKGHGYLIDLSDIQRLGAALEQSLHSFAVRARERGSAVVVCLRTGQRTDGAIIGASALPVTAPSGMAVLRSHLSVIHPTVDADILEAHPGMVDALTTASPASAARMAELAYEAHRTGPPENTDAWISMTLAAYQNWHTQLAAWFAEHRSDGSIYERVLLAAVAMLEGAPADEVLIAASRLAERLGVEPADPTGISGLGLASSLDAVKAKVASDRTVMFTDLAYAPAVLDYLWQEHPLVREPLLDWSIRVPKSLALAWPHLVSRHWLELAERHDDFTWVTRLFLAWARSPLTARVAIAMAGHVAALPREGRDMRSALYSIAKAPRDREIALAAVRVCGAYGAVAPATALTRLKWLADQDDDLVRDEVRRTLAALADSMEIHPQMLGELVEWADDPKQRGRSAVAVEAISYLLTVRGPDGTPAILADVLSTEHRTGLPLAAHAWRRLLVPEHTRLAEAAAAAWLDPLAAGRADFGTVAGVLTAAVQGSLPRVVLASKLVDYWRSGATVDGAVNTEVILRLYEHIHAADPLAADETNGGHAGAEPRR
ncbi:hypothetical protein CLV63_114171 [Murinocardiopsis flavida]|uniref:Uncharacterized protein n=1 Tax=Murinocardiopsis flavida TaxID=645275 RepID=A0A2P8DEV9_9ACTN|nr:hypothetical protein [Murinocardiopsis flavida]PSK95738.1 hypothetical protein CLV63_114171 [Murinocardiopsis flavida]